jgi:hypothetical protein
MSVLEDTVEKLKALPKNKVEAVALFIDQLNKAPSGRFDDLCGCVAPEEVGKMEKAINQAFEQIDEWQANS